MPLGEDIRPIRILLRLAATTGRPVRASLAKVGAFTWLVIMTLRGFLRLRHTQLGVLASVVKMQLKFTALDALPLATLTALLLGGITLLQVYGSLSGLGAEAYLSRLLAQMVIRELGPLMVGILIIARSGTAIATEMATMRINGEVDSLTALGIHPAQYLLVTRVTGGIISAFSLIIYFDAVALLGGFLLANLVKPLSLMAFLTSLGGAIGQAELWITLLKGIAFGGAIPLLSMLAGLRVQRAFTEIPQAVTRASVSALLTVLVISALLSAAFYV